MHKEEIKIKFNDKTNSRLILEIQIFIVLERFSESTAQKKELCPDIKHSLNKIYVNLLFS